MVSLLSGENDMAQPDLPLFPAQPRYQRVNSTNTAKQFIAVKKRLQRLICCHSLLGNNEAVVHVLD